MTRLIELTVVDPQKIRIQIRPYAVPSNINDTFKKRNISIGMMATATHIRYFFLINVADI